MVDKAWCILDFLNQYYSIARNIITKNNGIWDKAIGDGIMSWFGSINDTGSDDGASDANYAAIELPTSFEELQKTLKKSGTFLNLNS